DVCQQAERAARAAFDKLYGRYGRAKSPLVPFAGCGNDLFAAINLAGSQTALDHLYKRRGVLEQTGNVLPFDIAVRFDNQARGSVNDSGARRSVESYKTGRDAGDYSVAEFFGGCGTRSGLCAQSLKLALLRLKLRDDRLESFKHELCFVT